MLVEIGIGPSAGHASSRPACGASSSSASGLPPVAAYRRSIASLETSSSVRRVGAVETRDAENAEV